MCFFSCIHFFFSLSMYFIDFLCYFNEYIPSRSSLKYCLSFSSPVSIYFSFTPLCRTLCLYPGLVHPGLPSNIVYCSLLLYPCTIFRSVRSVGSSLVFIVVNHTPILSLIWSICGFFCITFTVLCKIFFANKS